MPWLIDYCRDAERTDRLVGRRNHIGLLAAGLFGEAGSVLTELKKSERETAAYPSYRNRLVEEIGDLLWYFARLVTVLAPSEMQKLDDLAARTMRPGNADAMNEALHLGGAAGALLATLQQETENVAASQLRTILRALLRVASAVHVDMQEAAQANLEKTQSRWPAVREFAPLFDDGVDDEERLPRTLNVEFRQLHRAGKPVVLLRCNGLNLGDRLTDNIEEPDFYRFHDIFHLAHAVYLGWSPILRVLLNCKRKSDPRVDENQDGARARITEEAVSAIVFSRAKETRFYDGIDQVDYDLLKTISEFVRGFEVEDVPLWQWEAAILNGYRVFRALRDNGGGTVNADLVNRHLHYAAPSPNHSAGEPPEPLATFRR